MEPIEVTAQFDNQGKITPVSFKWQGRTYPIESAGRRWQDDEGQHVLVMVAGEQIYELVFIPTMSRWFLGRYTLDRRVA
jgi:hypothetical protein